MRRQRFQIVLLMLGVALGYGYAFTHRSWHGHSWEHCSQSHGRDWGHEEHYDHSPEKPEK